MSSSPSKLSLYIVASGRITLYLIQYTMKVFEHEGKELTFEIGEELTVKELRKIAPFMQGIIPWQEIESIYQIGVKLSNNEEEAKVFIDSLNIDWFTKFSEFISEMIDVKKKMMKS